MEQTYHLGPVLPDPDNLLGMVIPRAMIRDSDGVAIGIVDAVRWPDDWSVKGTGEMMLERFGEECDASERILRDLPEEKREKWLRREKSHLSGSTRWGSSLQRTRKAGLWFYER